MLGQPISMLIPQVLGFRLTGAMPKGATATDLVLTITEALRKHGVVGKFVEFFGAGLGAPDDCRSRDARQHVPEYGATVAIFPIDDMTLDYLRLTGRDAVAGAAGRGVREGAGAVPHDAAARRGLLRNDRARSRDRRAEPRRTEAAAGSRVADEGEDGFQAALPIDDDAEPKKSAESGARRSSRASARRRRRRGAPIRQSRRARSRRGRHRGDHELHEHVEPERDDRRRPGGEEGGGARPDAQAVGEDEPRARVEGRDRVSERRRADAVSRSSSGSTSSATAARRASATAVRCRTTSSAIVADKNLVVCSVLSGNRNFEGRIQQQVRANYLASPPLVVAYALAGRMTIDLTTEPLGTDHGGQAGVPARTSGRPSARFRRRC